MTSSGLGFCFSDVGDLRLRNRLCRVGDRFLSNPESSIPGALQSVAEREAFYRLVNNQRLSASSILSGPFALTQQRASQVENSEILAIHDTTYCAFSTRRDGLGKLASEHTPYGFLAHVSLCVSLDSSQKAPAPLGLLALQTWTRGEGKAPMASEAQRWVEGVKGSKQNLPRQHITHVMDRECDSYALYKTLLSLGDDFVIRVCRDRLTPDGKLYALGAQAEVVAHREANLGARAPVSSARQRKRHPPRTQRTASLEIRARTVTIPPSGYTRKPENSGRESLSLNFIDVEERNVPEGATAVRWRLMTTKPIETQQQVLDIVDIYRARWCIEELFKALKTGCQFEKQQLESYEALIRSLCCTLPVACEILRLRIHREEEQLPASEILLPLHWKVLQLLAPKLTPDATAKQAIYAIAERGGHFKNNGPPGWLTLARGYDELLKIAEGVMLAQKM